jgi:hypothetical protein
MIEPGFMVPKPASPCWKPPADVARIFTRRTVPAR